MSMLATTLLGASGLVLLASAVGHLRDAAGTGRSLAAHDVLPARAHAPVARSLPALETVSGGALVLGTWFGLGGVSGQRLGAALATLLFAGFTVYLLLALRRHGTDSDLPCACGLGGSRLAPPAVLRAVLLTGFALVGGVAADGTGITTAAGSAVVAPSLQLLVTALATSSLAGLAAALPATRAQLAPAMSGGDR